MKIISWTLGLVLAASATPGVLAQQLLAAQSTISFTSRQMGVPVEGRFNRFSADVSFNPKKPEAGQLNIAIETASASFGVAETDAEVPRPAWFNAAAFPKASFVSSSIRPVKDGFFETSGKLTIKGVARELTIPFQLIRTGTQATATGTFTLKRLDFRIGEGEWADLSLVANDVQVKFKLVLNGVP